MPGALSAAVSPELLLERRQRTVPADRHDAGAPGDGGDVGPHDARPSPGEQSAGCDEQYEREVEHEHRVGQRPVARVVVCVAAGGAVLVYAWWATGLRPFAATTALAVVGPGVVTMAFGHTRRTLTTEHAPALAGTLAGWAVLFAALAAWQLQAYLQHPRTAHPTLSSLVNAALDTHVARTLAFTAWIAGAYRLARR